MKETKYISYEDPINGRSFTYEQMQEVYRDLANKEEYPDFDCWFTDEKSWISCYDMGGVAHEGRNKDLV